MQLLSLQTLHFNAHDHIWLAATVLNTLGTDDRSCPVWSYLQVLHSMSTFY